MPWRVDHEKDVLGIIAANDLMNCGKSRYVYEFDKGCRRRLASQQSFLTRFQCSLLLHCSLSIARPCTRNEKTWRHPSTRNGWSLAVCKWKVLIPCPFPSRWEITPSMVPIPVLDGGPRIMSLPNAKWSSRRRIAERSGTKSTKGATTVQYQVL